MPHKRIMRSGRILFPALFIGWSVFIFIGSSSARTAAAGAEKWSKLKLWYKQPAARWTEALPIGNGRLGAMVHGGVAEEHLQLNEETLWTGGPYDQSNPDALAMLPEVRRLVFAGLYREAQELFGAEMMGRPYNHQKYQPLGDLRLRFFRQGRTTDHSQQLTGYRRELDLDEGVARVEFSQGGVRFQREMFASPVDQVIVIRLTADQPGQISFSAELTGRRNSRPLDDVYARITDRERIRIPGDEYYMTRGAPPDQLILRGRNATYIGIKGRLEYQARVKATTEGGTMTVMDDRLFVEGADAVTLLVPAATGFVDYSDVSADPEERIRETLSAVEGKAYSEMREAHVREHHRLFRRVSLELAETEQSALPLDERLERFTPGGDPQLAALYFQYGRYLLISSSRPGTQPPNLQGIWNDSMNPAWSSKYTININLPMNYWPAEVTNLADCLDPLVEMINNLMESGGRIARVHYGARGWMLHHNTDIWMQAAPVNGAFVGTWPAGGAWLATHLWQHYLFQPDREFLEKAYPAIKGAALFFLDTLVEHPKFGWLVTCPSNSPENWYKLEGNRAFRDRERQVDIHATICAGPTIDSQILGELFEGCIQASKILEVDREFRQRVQETAGRLPPLRIGRLGQLQEWLEDWDDPEDKHRHLSHLWGLYPGSRITPRGTPELAAAARKSLMFRGEGGPCWAMGWKMNLWARLGDGERAHREFCNLINLEPFRVPGMGYTGGILPNLFNSHPPFQIDGNFGSCAGIAEMLMQSHAGEIELLPALPAAWAEGEVRGLRARGGCMVDISWSAGKLTRAVIRSDRAGRCRVRYGERTVEWNSVEGGRYPLDAGLNLI